MFLRVEVVEGISDQGRDPLGTVFIDLKREMNKILKLLSVCEINRDNIRHFFPGDKFMNDIVY